MHYTTDACGPTTQKLVDGVKNLCANQTLVNPEASRLNLLTLRWSPDSICRRMLQRNPTHRRSVPTSATAPAPARTGLERRLQSFGRSLLGRSELRIICQPQGVILLVAQLQGRLGLT